MSNGGGRAGQPRQIQAVVLLPRSSNSSGGITLAIIVKVSINPHGYLRKNPPEWWLSLIRTR